MFPRVAWKPVAGWWAARTTVCDPVQIKQFEETLVTVTQHTLHGA
jgi:hypothetical protein